MPVPRKQKERLSCEREFLVEERDASAFITTAEIQFIARNLDEVRCDAKTAGRRGNSDRMMVCEMMVCEMGRINAGLVAVHGENQA